MERVQSFTRTLDQELVALMRGVSLECPACGEFVMRSNGSLCCPECGFRLRDQDAGRPRLQLGSQAG